MGERRSVTGGQRAIDAVLQTGIEHDVVRHDQASSLAEAAELLGTEPRQIVKTLVVRRAEDQFVLVLVPGDRTFSWPKLRALLGTSRLSMPDAEGARLATGYERGTITPFGSTAAWPVIVDASISGRVSLGGGAHGVAIMAQIADVIRVLEAQVADISQ